MFRLTRLQALRSLGLCGKVLTLCFGIHALNSWYPIKQAVFPQIKCFQIPFTHSLSIGDTLNKVIRIERNGQFIGYAFCFANRFLVSTSSEIAQKKNIQKQYEYFIGDKKIETKFRVAGRFENLTFIEAKDDIIEPLPAHQNMPLYMPVQIVRKTTYISIKQGYYVANDSGFGIIDGKGEIGSLVLSEEGVFGIVTHIGRDIDQGFLRIVKWNEINNILRRLTQPPLYLGISAKALEERDGISIVRIAANSPLAGKIEMGEIITKGNNNPIHTPEDLNRVLMLSSNKIVFEVEHEGMPKRAVQIQI